MIIFSGKHFLSHIHNCHSKNLTVPRVTVVAAEEALQHEEEEDVLAFVAFLSHLTASAVKYNSRVPEYIHLTISLNHPLSPRIIFTAATGTIPPMAIIPLLRHRLFVTINPTRIKGPVRQYLCQPNQHPNHIITTPNSSIPATLFLFTRLLHCLPSPTVKRFSK